MYKAIIFDFDGTILDTETPECQSWQIIYKDYGLVFPVEHFFEAVGRGYDKEVFEPAHFLHNKLSGSVPHETLQEQHRTQFNILLAILDCRPGIREWIEYCSAKAVPCAIASSSPRSWIDRNASRLGILNAFTAIATKDDVGPGRTKPAPDLFLHACYDLGIEPAEALVIEDSKNGAIAASLAGCDCIVCPNPMTKMMAFPPQALIVDSLEDIEPWQVFAHFQRIPS